MYTIPEAERRSAAEHLPPVVYLPVAREDGPDGPLVELRCLDDGRTGLLVYTALDRLYRACGDYQSLDPHLNGGPGPVVPQRTGR